MKAGGDPLQAALKALPHGPEFRFLDRLLSLVPGQSGVGEYRVREDDFFLRGHLPGEPMLPGVLLVEAAAQLAGVVAQNDPDVPPLPRLKLAALRAVKFMGTARPGKRCVWKRASPLVWVRWCRPSPQPSSRASES